MSAWHRTIDTTVSAFIVYMLMASWLFATMIIAAIAARGIGLVATIGDEQAFWILGGLCYGVALWCTIWEGFLAYKDNF